MRGEIKWTDSDDYHWCKNNPDRRTFGSDSCYSWYGPPFNGGDSSDGFANSGKIVGQWDSGNTWRGDLSVGSFDGTDGFGSAVAYITSEKMKLEPLSERKFSLERKSSNTKINFPINISDSTTSRQSTNSRSNQNLYSANYTVENIEGILGGTLYWEEYSKLGVKFDSTLMDTDDNIISNVSYYSSLSNNKTLNINENVKTGKVNLNINSHNNIKKDTNIYLNVISKLSSRNIEIKNNLNKKSYTIGNVNNASTETININGYITREDIELYYNGTRPDIEVKYR